MASKVSLAIRREVAWIEIRRLVATMSEQADMPNDYFKEGSRYREIQDVLDVEEFARFLKDLDAALSPIDEPEEDETDEAEEDDDEDEAPLSIMPPVIPVAVRRSRC